MMHFLQDLFHMDLPCGVACSRNAVMFRIPAEEESLWSACRARFAEHGAALLWERDCADNSFAAYTDRQQKYSLSLLRREEEIRVIAEPMPRIPKFEAMGEVRYPCVTLTQFSTHTSYSTRVRGSASGMGYVLRLTDGRLIVIDGGFHLAPEFEDDYPDFIALLRELSEGALPRVALWILTHPHPDHYGLLKQLKPEDAAIDTFMTTLPPEGISDSTCRDMLENIPGLAQKNLPAHTGDCYSFGDAELEIYYTCEEAAAYDPQPIRKDVNNQSLIFGIRVKGQQIMFTGDARYPAADRAIAIGGERLRSDICQIAHHGRTVKGDDRFYAFVAPKTALWPACRTQIDFDTSHMEGVNEWIFSEESTVTDHYVANDGTFTFSLPYTARGVPYSKTEGKNK